MRIVNKAALVVMSLLASLGVAGRVAAVAAPGLTVAPAAITLSLPAGSDQQTARFAITNNYAGAVDLRLRFEQSSADAAAGHKAAVLQLMSLSEPDITLAPGQAVQEVITLRDDTSLAPGSQTINLVITQADASTSVGVLPQLQLPMSIIKQDGAVNSIALSAVHRLHLAFAMPDSVTVELQNTGNITVIPRGFAAVTSPNASVLRKGTMNIASTALPPGGRLQLQVPLTTLAHATWPGFYRVTVSYGLGGDQAPRTVSSRFLYIAWWHIALAVVVIALGYAGGCALRRTPTVRTKQHKRPPSKRRKLIGRGIA